MRIAVHICYMSHGYRHIYCARNLPQPLRLKSFICAYSLFPSISDIPLSFGDHTVSVESGCILSFIPCGFDSSLVPNTSLNTICIVLQAVAKKPYRTLKMSLLMVLAP